MPVDPQRIQSIFLSAIEAADPADRAALLARECGDDAELRQRIEVLLQAHDRSGSFLDQPAVPPVTTDAPAGQWIDREAPLVLAERPGMRVGRYKLLQQIGEGGMGVVYMAEQQEPVRRMIALKIIKPGMDSDAVVARFEAERQALALMDHQNIARVFDGGTTDSGRPFFVMELVKGIPITRFCDENRLSPRERLQLFVSVCEAVQHAHQKGVIHRDLKPSNVLVTLYDGKPVPKVIDFGVAKALHQKLTERTMFTAFGAVVGTLEYMSPEQAEMNALDVDTRSDVYSLGVLLYELLTGTTPLERERLRKAAYTEMLRLIREEEPLRPSMRISGSGQALARISAQRKTEPAQLARLVRGELDWIVMKALEKDRGRRYETATGLARDVERYLKDEPVEACPPSVGYRLGKFARKYQVMLSTASAFVALLLITTGVSIWLARAAQQAEAIANQRSDEAEKAERDAAGERDRSQQEWRRAEDAANQAKTNAAETGRALDRISVAKGIELAGNDDLFTALLWFVKPLERGGLLPEDEWSHRTRYACYLRHTHGRPVLRQMLFHNGKVRELAFSPDTAKLLTTTEKEASVWDLNTGGKVTTLERSNGVIGLRFMEGRRISGLKGASTRIWDTTTGRLLDSRTMDSEFITAAFTLVLPRSPLQALGSVAVCKHLADSRTAATLSADGRLHLCRLGNQAWLCDLFSGKLLHHWPIAGPDGRIDHSAFSANARRILLATAKQARVYDVATGVPVGAALTPDKGIDQPSLAVRFGEFHELQIGSDGSRVLLMEGTDHVAIWDTITGKRISPVFSNQLAYPTLSPDGRTLAFTEGWDSLGKARFTLWGAEQSRLIASSNDQEDVPLSIRFSPDSSNVIAAGKNRADKIWDVHAGRAAGPVLPNFGLRAAHEFSPDGSMVAVANGDGIVRVWHLAGYANSALKMPRDLNRLMEGFRVWRFAIDRPPFSRRFTSRTIPSPKRLSGLCESLKVLPSSVHDADVFAQFSPDGHRLVTVAAEQNGIPGSTALLWDAAAGRLLGQPIGHPESPTHIEFSADSRLLVTASAPGPIRLYDARTGEPIGSPLEHGDGVYYACFSSDGRRLAICSADGTAQIWDMVTASPIGTRLRHTDAVSRVVFSPNGRQVATASSDGTVRLWDAATGRPVGRMLEHGYPLFDIDFDSQGKLLLTYGWRANDGFRIWDVATQQALSPNIFRLTAEERVFWSMEAVLDTEGLWVPNEQKGKKYDLRPDQRPTEDLVKLAQLHAGRRLDEQGNLAPLTKAELIALWDELRARYPAEFTVSTEAVRAWHLERIKTLEGIENDTKQTMTPAIRFHREWLKKLNAKQP